MNLIDDQDQAIYYNPVTKLKKILEILQKEENRKWKELKKIERKEGKYAQITIVAREKWSEVFNIKRILEEVIADEAHK